MLFASVVPFLFRVKHFRAAQRNIGLQHATNIILENGRESQAFVDLLSEISYRRIYIELVGSLIMQKEVLPLPRGRRSRLDPNLRQ